MLLRTSYNNKTCEWVRKRFSEYLDGVIPEEERLQVHEHLRFCEPCSDELDNLCKTIAMLVDFREEVPDSIQSFRLPRSTFIDFIPSIFPTIEEQDAPITFSIWAPYLSALLLFFLVISGWVSMEKHVLGKQYYNDSNYVEVRAEI